MLQQMTYYNTFMPHFYTPYLQYQIKQFRLFLQDPVNLVFVLLVYPAQPIADDYLPLEEYWLLKAQEELNYIVLTGP